MKIVSIALMTGFVGDFLLQLLTFMGAGGETGWGLNRYFAQHGRFESMFVAAGMMGIFYMIYVDILGLELNWIYLSLYGVLLDLVFRLGMLFPSLIGYYTHLNYFWSAVWGAIPMLLPFWINGIISK